MSFTYRGLQATQTRHMVTAEEIDNQFLRLQQQSPCISIVEDRPTQKGDEVVLDYAGFCDGVQFPGGTAEMQTLVLGSGTFIPGFEDQLLGKNAGDEVTVLVTFPEQYHSEDLAGKAAEFRCKIHQIRVKSQYELDDTFAREVGGCESIEEMRGQLAENLQTYFDQRGEMELQERLLAQAAETLDFDPSEEEVQKGIDEQLQNMRSQLSQQGLSLEMYCQFTGTSMDALREQSRGAAVTAAKMHAAVDRILELEKLEPTEDEFKQALNVIAQNNGMTVEQMKPYMNPEFEAAVKRSVLTGKVMHLIRTSAVITQTEE